MVRGAGIGRTGIKHNINLSGKRKGLPSRDQITSLKQSIKDISGKHTRANLPERDMAEGQLEFNTPDPVVVVQDLKGNILDKINLSVAAQKYKLGAAQNIKNQLAHQNYTTIGNYVIVSPMSGQPQDATTQGVAEDDTHQIKGNELIEYLVKRFDMTREQAIELLKKKGLAEDNDAVAAFMARGGEIQQLKPAKPRKGERWQGSAHIGSATGRGNTKGRVSGLGANTSKTAKPVVTAEDSAPTHRIGLTVTDPNHPMVSKRKEAYQKSVRVTSHDKEKAINSAIAHHRRKGYQVHDHHYMGTVAEGIDIDPALAAVAKKYPSAHISKDGKVIQKPVDRPYTPPQQDAKKQQRDLTAKYPNIDDLVAAAERNRDPYYDRAEGNAYYRGREAEQNYQKLKQIQRVIQGLNESLQRTQP